MLPTITTNRIELSAGTLLYKANQLEIYQLESNQYWRTEASRVFPSLPMRSLIQQYVNRSWEVGSSVALRELRQGLKS
ncbi:MAG: hypothetical protein SAJ12_04380 [Jaaginema sp. PMC 1079.18]|nr:hypothetical protein [Jaaginema sp. PMC 1080.18]MEC4850227.1 hypothetical protein [Jaaginema sp. PMC 1079.18]MEC4865888.1 hypothetical protein [Jaaginema sp. PMC 1078.18]